jgi:hypothetical protein
MICGKRPGFLGIGGVATTHPGWLDAMHGIDASLSGDESLQPVDRARPAVS